MISRFKFHFLKKLQEDNMAGGDSSVFGDVGAATATWPHNSDFYNKGDTRLPSGPAKKKKKKKDSFVQFQLLPLQRRNLNRTT
jgi:hypothetical protein